MVGNKLPFGSGGWSQKKLPVSKLDLDLMNARFRDDAENQTQALEFMLAVAGEKCLELLKDLCMSGDLNPSDLPIVVAEGNRYRVLEGNRRLACLKIWKKPGLLDSISEDLRNEYKRRFESVIQKAPYAPPNEIKVVVVDSIEDADGWIDKKHGRGKGGASTVEWNAFEKDRRQYRQTNKKTRAFSFVDMLNAEYGDELEMMQSLSVLLKGQYTILERILNNPVMCDDLGVRYESDGRTRLDQGAKSMRPFFARLLDDLAQKRQDSRSLRKKEETSKYLTLLREETLGNENLSSANANKPPEPTKNDLAGGAEANSYPLKGSENQSKVKGAAPVKKPRKRKPTVRVLQGVSMDGFSGKTAKLVEDTAVLSVDKNPVIVAILLRVILDIACYQFLKRFSKEEPPHSLDEKIKRVLKIIDPQVSGKLGKAETTKPFDILFRTVDDDKNYLRLVQFVVHSSEYSSTASETKELADRFEPMLVAMNERMRQNKVS